MDEILIGEKKYVSSKRAAKMTGYAKDYIGQLCREGRVPARLVGRSWYVLETAIQDHRFGDKKSEQEMEAVPSSAWLPAPTWETPHYEASSGEVLPSVNRLQLSSDDSAGAEDHAAPEDESKVSQYLQDSWKAWFDHVGAQNEPAALAASEKQEEVMEAEESIVEEAEKKDEESDVAVPIHVVYEPPPEEFLPVRIKGMAYEQEEVVEDSYEEPKAVSRLLIRAVQAVGMLVAIALLGLATIGSGYFDKYIISINRAGIISGAELYIK